MQKFLFMMLFTLYRTERQNQLARTTVAAVMIDQTHASQPAQRLGDGPQVAALAQPRRVHRNRRDAPHQRVAGHLLWKVVGNLTVQVHAAQPRARGFEHRVAQ